MANSCLEVSVAPSHFVISDSFEESTGAISVAVERCQLCSCSKRPFICTSCVRKGNFTHSKSGNGNSSSSSTSSSVASVTSERYSEKLVKWQKLKREREDLLLRIEDAVKHDLVVDSKKIDAELCKQRIQLLKQSIQESCNSVTKDKASLRKAQEVNKTRSKKKAVHNQKKIKIQNYIAQLKEKLEKAHEKSDADNQEIVGLRRGHIEALTTDIFPIAEIQAKSDPCTVEKSTVGLLAEARHTSYIRGRWVYTDNGGEHQYSVVSPTLLGNGDYTAYSLWLSENKEMPSGPDSEFSQRNPAYNIGAALSYTAQLVTLLASYVGITLPKRQCYSEFYGDEMSERDFNKAVYKLNYNVLYLCMSQNIKPEYLQPKHTVSNLLRLLRCPDLGRMGSISVDNELLQSFEESHEQEEEDLSVSALGEEVLTPENPGEYDWEQVPTTLPEPDITPENYLMSTTSSRSPFDTASASSIASGFMSSAAASITSFWRGATGTKSPTQK